MVHPNELDQQIDNLRTLQQSYDQIAGAAEAYNTGKVQLAEAITSKGVETSPTETYPEMAEKVNAISQETYQINGGEMYAKQLFGSLDTPNYWNLYEVLAQLLSDGRLVNYGGILLAEYYKGYDSLALSGAGAGGAYVVSDKDANGQFIMYTADTTHTWSTEDDGKGNRFVAYCFADEYHDFQITDTNTSPRSIFIGRKVGKIMYLADGRASQIVIPDGNELKSIVTNNHAQQFGKNVILRNINEGGGAVYIPQGNDIINSVYIKCKKIESYAVTSSSFANSNQIASLIVCSDTVFNSVCLFFAKITYLGYLHIEADSITMQGFDVNDYGMYPKCVSIVSESVHLQYGVTRYGTFENCSMYLYYKENDKTRGFNFGTTYIRPIKDIILQQGWNKPLIYTGEISTEENMYAHILQRLKQDEPDCGDGVTITLGATNLAKLTSQESIDLLDSLTNTYGYTFA